MYIIVVNTIKILLLLLLAASPPPPLLSTSNMEKIKTRWRKNYLEGDTDIGRNDDDTNDNQSALHNQQHDDRNNHLNNHHHSNGPHNNCNDNNFTTSNHNNNKKDKHLKPPTYEPITENLYLDKRSKEHSRSRKDARSMVCDCILTKEERARGILGCLDDCLNRMLMIECGPKCALGDHCLNKRFQKCQSAQVEIFKTRKKGWGLRTTQKLPANSFIMEYVGEVIKSKEFRSRVKEYNKQKVKHHYFMALRSDEIIDATVKGNMTRFINHSCEPNCETQKWTVNGDLRIGFFTIKDLEAGDEVTFDYQFQRYGRKAQKCYCEAPSCRGYIGGNEQTLSLDGNASSPLINKSHKKSFKHGLLLDVTTEDKITALAENAAQGLKTKEQVIALASLSLKAEEVKDRRKLLEIIRVTKSDISLRLFVDYHGLEIICLWMRDPDADYDFKSAILDILERLPISNKTKVLESNVYRMVERWANEEPKPVAGSTESNDLPDTNGESKTDELSASQESDKSTTNNENRDNHDSTTQPSSQTSDDQPTPQQHLTNSTNIRHLANRLLKKFQALSPGFKIPRLNRLQRMEIEKKMEEEMTKEETQNDRSTSEQKNLLSARNYFRNNTLNGTDKKDISSKTAQPAIKRKFDSITNNIDLTPAPRLSKEEHRLQFEMHVRLKDYYDTIEKHYGFAAAEQMKMNQRAFANMPMNNLPGPMNNLPLSQLAFFNPAHLAPPILTSQPPPQLNHQPPIIAAVAAGLAPDTTLHTAPPPIGLELDPSKQTVQQPNLMTPIAQNSANYHDLYEHPEPSVATSSITNDVTMEPVRPEPTRLPSLVILANNSIEAAHEIDDDLAFNICDYDEHYWTRDKPLGVEDVVNDPYPCPGSYYTTPEGESWFATVTLDRKAQQPRTVILNLQIRSDAEQSQTASPIKQTTKSITTTQTLTSNKQQAPSSTDTYQESPNNENIKIKKKLFEHGVSKFIKDALSAYYKPDCPSARITSKEDFVFLARKLTLAVLEKELNRKGCNGLTCNKQVRRKVEDFVRTYMTKFGKIYTRI